jgi:hypothetical protein
MLGLWSGIGCTAVDVDDSGGPCDSCFSVGCGLG